MRAIASLTSFILGLGVYLAAALPVAACDCMAYEGMAAYAGSPDWAVFSGTVQNPEPDGTPIVNDIDEMDGGLTPPRTR